MELQNLYQICIFFSVGLMVFTLAVNFTVGLGVFGDITPSSGIDVYGQNSSDAVGDFTKNPDIFNLGVGDLWIIVFGGAGIAAIGGSIAIAIATQNASFVGVYLFGVFFWSSYINTLGILAIVAISPALLLLFSIPIGFIFVGAVIGMLAGV